MINQPLREIRPETGRMDACWWAVDVFFVVHRLRLLLFLLRVWMLSLLAPSPSQEKKTVEAKWGRSKEEDLSCWQTN